MRVVNLDQKIHHRELQLVRPQPAGLALRREAVPRAEILQNIGGLADQQPPGLQKRRRQGRSRSTAIQYGHHCRDAGPVAGFTRHIAVLRAALFHRQAHEFAAALNRGPIVEFINHGLTASSTGKMRQVVLPCAYSLPAASVKRASAVAIRDPTWMTWPSQLTTPVVIRSGRT